VGLLVFQRRGLPLAPDRRLDFSLAMSRWNDLELEAAEKARKYRPWWMRGLRVLAWVVLLAAGALLALALTDRLQDRVPSRVAFWLAMTLNFTLIFLETRWRRQHPNSVTRAPEHPISHSET
jgi:hypothetical protein